MPPHRPSTTSRQGSLILAILLLTSQALAAPTPPGTLTRVAQRAEWQTAVSAAAIGNTLYILSRAGTLWRFPVGSGKPTLIAGIRYHAPRLLIPHAGALLVFDGKGDLYRLDPRRRDSQRLGKPGAWKAMIGATLHKGKIYSVERDGKLYRTDPRTAAWQIVGNPGWANTKWIFSTAQGLYTIERVGALYTIDAQTGSWKRTGRFGAWAATTALATLAGALYSTEQDGKFYQTDLTSGRYRQLGQANFGKIRLLVAVAGRLFGLDSAGTLFGIALR